MHVLSLDNKLEPGERIGLIAGAGRFPIIFAEAARGQGLSVHGVGIQGMVDDELESLCDTWDSFPICKVGRAIRSCLRNDAHHAVMAGKVEKVELFAPGRFWNFVPDWRAIHMLWSYVFTKDRRDDTILLAVIREFERDNITFGSALEYCPELLVEHGFLTRRKPSPTQWRYIRFGLDIAKQMGGLDIGQ